MVGQNTGVLGENPHNCVENRSERVFRTEAKPQDFSIGTGHWM
jgi:hypothetical protein